MDKYTRWYNQIVQNGKQLREGYTERHHIIPQSLGGTNDAANLTNLTAREHFVCHWLLTKIHTTGEEHWKMLNAFRMMRAENPRQQRYQTKITARVYENLKKEYAELQSVMRSGKGNGFYGKTHTKEARQKISDANKGRVQPLEEKARQIAAITGRKRAPFNNEWLAKLKENHKSKQPGFNGSLSEDTRRKIGDKIRGRKQTEEEKMRRSLANLGKVKPKKLCPHCQQMIAVNGYARWHGPNCRALKS